MSGVRDSLAGQTALLSQLLSEAMEPELRRHGLTPSTFDLLAAIHGAGKVATQISVARRLGISPASLSEALSLATRNGWVERTASDIDSRAKIVQLTGKGQRALRAVLNAVNLAENEMVQGLHPEDLAKAIDVLRQANRNLASALTNR